MKWSTVWKGFQIPLSHQQPAGRGQDTAEPAGHDAHGHLLVGSLSNTSAGSKLRYTYCDDCQSPVKGE